MTLNQIIESALNNICDGNIWPMVCPLEELPEKYIVYNPANLNPGDYGDDEDLVWVDISQVHYYVKGNANYLSDKQKIISELRKKGIRVQRINIFYDGTYNHITFYCETLEDLDGNTCG